MVRWRAYGKRERGHREDRKRKRRERERKGRGKEKKRKGGRTTTEKE